MENPPTHRSIYEATLSCRQRLRQCIDVPALMVDEWPQKRLADFNLWASDSGALAKQTASLDQRLAEKRTVRQVILNLLSLLESLLGRIQNLGQDEDDRTSLQETIKDVEDIMDQLVSISVAIRRAAQPARLDRADDSFNPQRHQELRRHLEIVMLAASLSADQKVGGNADFDLSPEKTWTCSAVSQRLIWANLLRRHRYLYARRRWMKQTAEREPVSWPTSNQERSLPTPRERPHEPLPSANVSRHEENEPGPELPTPAIAAPSIITSTVPTAIQGPIQIPQGSQLSMTAPSSTSSKVVYPKPPRTREGAMFFRCPCCFQTLPISSIKPYRWRKHLSEDIYPYTCILDDCPKPQQLYLTRKEWKRHMQEEHETAKYWLCTACLEPARFDLESYFDGHLRTQHGAVISEDQIPIFIAMSTYTAPPSLVSCPLCPPPPPDEEADAEAVLDHAAEHVHSFSLRSLPWPIPEEGELDYLGLGPNDCLDDADFFDVASGVDSADRSKSSDSQGSRRADEMEELVDLVFEDETPDVPWEPYLGEGETSIPHRPPSAVPDTLSPEEIREMLDGATWTASIRREAADSLPRDQNPRTLDEEPELPRRSPFECPWEIPWDYSVFRKPSKPTTRILPNVRTWAEKLLDRATGFEEIIRQEIGSKHFNNFKQAWASVDPRNKGWITKESFPRLLGRLSEPFQMRIYPAEHSVHAIIDDTRDTDHRQIRYGLSLDKLKARLAMIDVKEIRDRRRCFEQFYEDIMVASDPHRGISRKSVLRILAFYCLGESTQARCVHMIF
ncbi:hypothetical protein V8F06_014485 [Rhypophila decipiens]